MKRVTLARVGRIVLWLCLNIYALCPLGSGPHQLPMLSNERFRRAGFDEITSNAYTTLKCRLVVASETIHGRHVSEEEFAKLDEVIASGIGFIDLMKAYHGYVDEADPTGSMIGSFVSQAKAWTIGNYDEGEARIQSMLRRASRQADPHVLNTISRDWVDRVPRSAHEVLTLATQWILERLETQSNSFTHRFSDDQFRSGEHRYRAEVENTFKPMISSRLHKMKEEVNKTETENSSGCVAWLKID